MSIAVKQLLEKCTGFDWDKANENKNWQKHKVTAKETEQSWMFLNGR